MTNARRFRILRSPFAALVPPLILGLCIWLWAVDVLNWDEWIIWAGVLEKLHAGVLTLADLIVQQNEQRNLAARLFGLLLFPAFGLNRLAECALNIALAGGLFLLVRRLYSKSALPDSDHAPLLAISLLSFSLLQWETFSVGINSSVLLPPLGMWAGAVLAASGALSWTRLGLLVLTGLIPSFCFVNGLFYWLCLAPLVALHAEGQTRRILMTSAFVLAGALAWTVYFHGFARPPQHPSPFLALTHPFMLGGYFLAYLGGALVGDKNLLPLAFLAGCAALWLLFAHVQPSLAALRKNGWRQSREDITRLSPWLAVIAFTLLSAMATAVGRSGFGLGQALESRYATFSTPLWLAVVCLHWQRARLLKPNVLLWARRVLAACLALFLVSSVLSAVVLHNRAPKLAAARAEIFHCTDPQKLEAVFPDPAYVMLKLPLFLEYRAAMYRDIKQLSDYTLSASGAGNFRVDKTRDAADRLCGLRFAGQTQSGQGLVFLALPERIVAVAQANTDGAFELFVPDNALPEGTGLLRAFALAADKRTLRPLGPRNGVLFSNPLCSPPVMHLEKYFYVR
jgi:hypothetical protein